MTRSFERMAGALLLATGLLAALPAAGQMPGLPGQQRMIRLGFGGGVSVPTGAAADALKSGVNGQAFVLVNAIGIPLRFNLGYQKFDFKDALAAGNQSMLSGLGGINLDLLKAGPVTPYITAGLGAFSVKQDIESGAFSGSTSEVHFGVDGGAGFRLRLGRLEAFAEGRVQNVYTDAGAIDSKSIKAIPVTFGVLF